MSMWVRKLQLTADDAVFAGREIQQMQSSAAGGSAMARVAAPAPPTSLRLQAEWAARVGRDAVVIAHSTGLDRFGDAGLAVLASANLRKAIDTINSFAPLLNVRHRVTLSFSESDVVLGLERYPGIPHDVHQLLLPLDIAKLHRFLADMFQLEALPSSIGGPAHMPVAQIRLPAAFASRALPGHASATSLEMQRACRRQMEAMERAALRETVRRLLLREGEEPPSLAQTAQELGLSTRTFRRRLAEQGTAFMQILNDVRCTLALRYLTASQLTTDAIAERLGYSESANFRHAFRRWTGSSPRRFCASAAAVREPLPARVASG